MLCRIGSILSMLQGGSSAMLEAAALVCDCMPEHSSLIAAVTNKRAQDVCVQPAAAAAQRAGGGDAAAANGRGVRVRRT